MKNYKSNALSELNQIERVYPNNGRRETLWVAVAITIITVLAGIGLSINRAAPVEKSKHIQLSIEAKRVLTDLRNAADEIIFSSQDSHTPSIDELKDWDLPPFIPTPGVISQYEWKKIEPHCFVGLPKQDQNPSFILSIEDNISQIHWSFGVKRIIDCHENKNWIKDEKHN